MTPAEVKTQLVALAGDLLEYTEIAEAVEYRQSVNERTAQTPLAIPEIDTGT